MRHFSYNMQLAEAGWNGRSVGQTVGT